MRTLKHSAAGTGTSLTPTLGQGRSRGPISLHNAIGASDEVTAFTGCLHVALGVAGLVASAGLWILKKWGVALAIVVSVLNALSATPGASFAPTADLFGSAVVGVAVFALIVVLVVLPGTLRAFT